MIIAEKQINNVCIIDDSAEAREGWSLAVEDAKLKPILQTESVADIDEYIPYLQKFDAIVTDHHLKTGKYFPVNGAEVVYKCYDFKIPSILVTRYDDNTVIDEIRKYRSKIPVILSQEDYDPDTLRRGLEVCINEFKGKVSEERELSRTFIRVDDVDANYIYLIIPGWNPHKVVSVKKDLLPMHILPQLSSKAKLFAKVNTGARDTLDLFFTSWEI